MHYSLIDGRIRFVIPNIVTGPIRTIAVAVKAGSQVHPDWDLANDARESPKPLTHSLKGGCCVYGPFKEVIHGNRTECCYCLDPDQIGDESKDGFSLVFDWLTRLSEWGRIWTPIRGGVRVPRLRRLETTDSEGLDVTKALNAFSNIRNEQNKTSSKKQKEREWIS